MSQPFGPKQDAGTYRQVQLWLWPERGLYEFTFDGRVYQFGTLSQTTDMIDSLVLPEIEPSEETRFIETYRGVSIYENPLGLYEFTYEERTRQFYTLDLTRAYIDRLILPPEEVIEVVEEPEEEAPEILPEMVPAPSLPWYAAWVKPIADYIGTLTENVVNFFSPIFKGMAEIPANIMNLPSHVFTALIDRMLDISLKASESSITQTLAVAQDVTGGTPEWKKQLDDVLTPVAVSNVKGMLEALSPEAIGKSPLNWEEAKTAAIGIGTTVTGLGVGLWLSHAAAEAASLGQYEGLKDLDNMVMAKLGLSSIGSKVVSIPLDELVFKKTQQFYAAQFTPEIPTPSELINMVVKEKMTLEDFIKWMKYRGLSEEWSNLFWEAHFIHPSYGEIRRAFYRSDWDQSTLEAYLKRVDLDPEFNEEIWLKNLGEIPPYSELVNQRVKEVIGEKDFTEGLKFHGITGIWSKRIWDAHFQPPSLGDILTAYRRKIPVNLPYIDEDSGEIKFRQVEQLSLDDVRDLMVLVDLDPRYKDIFETRFYRDPSINMTRYMYETGAIGPEKVPELVEREGYWPEYIGPISDYILRFQERRWRTRYLVQLQRGYLYRVYEPKTLIDEVEAAGYTKEVGEWMVKTADVQRAIMESQIRGGKPKIISLGELKKAYLNDRISESELRVELNARSYEMNEIELLITVLNDEKSYEAAGGKKLALTQAELLNAWKYQQLTEDQLRIELSLRGLSTEEVDILINTKKLQWGIETE